MGDKKGFFFGKVESPTKNLELKYFTAAAFKVC
jgi:hypothetical protein